MYPPTTHDQCTYWADVMHPPHTVKKDKRFYRMYRKMTPYLIKIDYSALFHNKVYLIRTNYNMAS